MICAVCGSESTRPMSPVCCSRCRRAYNAKREKEARAQIAEREAAAKRSAFLQKLKAKKQAQETTKL